MSGLPVPKQPQPKRSKSPRWKKRFRSSDPKRNPQLAHARRDTESRAGGRCEARTEKCTGRGCQAHHILRRGQGGPDELGNLLWVCNECHLFIHANPKLSFERGWLRRREAS